MFRALLCPSSGARQTAVAASGFRMNVGVDVFSAVVGLCEAAKAFSRATDDRHLWFPYECGSGRVLSRGRFVRSCNGSLTGS